MRSQPDLTRLHQVQPYKCCNKYQVYGLLKCNRAGCSSLQIHYALKLKSKNDECGIMLNRSTEGLNMSVMSPDRLMFIYL